MKPPSPSSFVVSDLSPALGDKSPTTDILSFTSLSRGAFLLFLLLALLVISLRQPEPTPFTMQGAIIWGLTAAMWAVPTWRVKEQTV